MPRAAVTGAAIAESVIVVQNEFQAAPVHSKPWPVLDAKAFV